MKRQSTGFFQLAIIHLFSSFLTWILPCHGCRRPTCWTWRPTRGRWWRPPGGWEQAPLSSASSSKLLPSDTEDSGPWADGPWPPMAGELRWSLRRKQQCHPPLLPMLPQATPTHSHWLRIPFGDFWGFLGSLWSIAGTPAADTNAGPGQSKPLKIGTGKQQAFQPTRPLWTCWW